MPTTFRELVVSVLTVISYIVPLLVALALVYFLRGMAVYYFIKGEYVNDKKKAKELMIWGIIGLFVMTSLWGIVNIGREFLLNPPSAVPTSGSGMFFNQNNSGGVNDDGNLRFRETRPIYTPYNPKNIILPY